MTASDPLCPDCGVTMEAMALRAGGHRPQFVSAENRDGVLGKLGVSQRYDAESYVCPECGLSRLYAAVDE
ncbi:MAG: hypothetical protein A07HB70_00387 [uncultured archaeon A07HB70]|nr:MAG: hypothetical protein A07HB70_00387 [uncultured archaeon A07HB70]